MKLFSFGPGVGRVLTEYGSRGVRISGMARAEGEAQISCARFEADGTIGVHPTGRPQLFCVVEGEGWVSGEDGERLPISAGQAVYWETGEVHESGTDTAMTVLIVQPAEVRIDMPEVSR